MSVCRSCEREIEWVVVAKSGKNMPIDADPVPNGNIAKLPTTDGASGNALVEYVHPGGDLLATQQELYVSHFSTCPEAAAWRRGDS